METISKIISAGLITGAVFTLFLYSPVASPELYRSNDLTNLMLRPGVNFERKSTKLSKSKKDGYQRLPELQNKNPFPESRNLLSQAETKAFDPFGHNSTNVKKIYATSSSTVKQTDGNFILSNGKTTAASRKYVANSSQPHGFIALRTAVTTEGSSLSDAATDDISGGSSPGDQPTGDVLPVTDGLGLLILMAMGFGVWKKIRLTKIFKK